MTDNKYTIDDVGMWFTIGFFVIFPIVAYFIRWEMFLFVIGSYLSIVVLVGSMYLVLWILNWLNRKMN